MPPIYDDVGYLLDAYLRLTSERVSSIFETLRSFYLDPPHAPFSTLAAMLGFSLIGPKLAAPYMMGIWPLALYAFAIYIVVRRELSPSVSGVLAVCFLFARAPQLLMSEFRPDIPAGVVFAVAIYLLIFTNYVSMASCAVAGIVAALAIMAKPTAFVATIPVLCAASFIGVVRPFDPAIQDRRMLYRNAAIGVLSALVILMPFGLIWGPSIADYTYAVLVTAPLGMGVRRGRIFSCEVLLHWRRWAEVAGMVSSPGYLRHSHGCSVFLSTLASGYQGLQCAGVLLYFED